jgi:hypothetical protein
MSQCKRAYLEDVIAYCQDHALSYYIQEGANYKAVTVSHPQTSLLDSHYTTRWCLRCGTENFPLFALEGEVLHSSPVCFDCLPAHLGRPPRLDDFTQASTVNTLLFAGRGL